jgi:putative endonuclease
LVKIKGLKNSACKNNRKLVKDKQATGKLGESLAAALLQQKGFRILHRNYRLGRAEVDLIAASDKLLLFIEVKTRRGPNSFGYPEEAVDKKKAARITWAAGYFIERIDWKGAIRFDVIAVQLPTHSNAQPQLHHFEDAFY